MTFFQALLYFLREAAINLIRGWKVGFLVAMTIAVSLFVGGVFFLMSAGITASVEGWRREAKVVVYLNQEADAAAVAAVREAASGVPWIARAEPVSAAEAARRFEAAFPRMAELLGSEDPLPPSVEFELMPGSYDVSVFETWAEELREQPQVAMVDDDRQWLRQVDLLATVLRGGGLALGALLLAAAIFTTASVIRLTAHVYRQEISVLRLVGGTEFFIRGPFVVEGALQGLAGGVLASGALLGLPYLLRSLAERAPESLTGGLLAPAPPTLALLGGLILIGGAAGLAGAIVSMRRERPRASV